jgi:hypothetical protein
VLQFPPGQADAVRQGLGIGDREGVHRERRMSGIRRARKRRSEEGRSGGRGQAVNR